MKSSIKLFPLSFIISVVILSGCASMNQYQREGTLILKGLKNPVTVLRDDKGMAYIHARDMDDALMAQGFVTAQDRLFQMELTRLFASGRICELAGEKAKPVDIRTRTIGFFRHAKKHIKLLDGKAKGFLQKYVDGVNAYIKTRSGRHHLEFKLAGIKPTPWTMADSLAIVYYLSWDSSANVKTEMMTQMLVEKMGPQKAGELFPLNINPDEGSKQRGVSQAMIDKPVRLGLLSDQVLAPYLKDGALRIGSNNWAAGPTASPGGKPIVANDTHQDARMLPGPWYPCGLITPAHRIVGTGVPGTPGIVVGRNEHMAIGVTNAYGDSQDLYVETLDPKNPNRYMEGQNSIPFDIIEETLTIKDKKATGGVRKETLKIRRTGRGPVISGVMPGLRSKKVLTLRWAPFETMGPSLGLDRIMTARSVKEIREALKDVNWIMLNFVFADKGGNIGWHASGKLPVRSQGDGTVPFVVKDGRDNWTGWIPFDQMPQSYNPERGWVGTCNHKTVKKDYPFYYSSHMSPSYRYRRLKQLLNRPGKKSVHDHWQFQRDTLNLMAKAIAPVMARALVAHEETREMGQILSTWDFRDDIDKAAPTIFQAVYRQFAFQTFQDELGEDLARTMLDNWYFWQERLERMVHEETSPWFDNTITGDKRETRDDIFYLAALQASKELGASLGRDPKKWLWGKVHRHEFVSPIRRKGFGKGLVGGGSHSAPGSGETLYRGIYDFKRPFAVTISASQRMVADLGDADKVLGVLPGGASGRLFDPHIKDQIKPFMSGEKVYWWFSDRAIKEHTRTSLIMQPK
jgi:penicillin amidase